MPRWARVAGLRAPSRLLSLQARIARVTRHDLPFVGFAREQATRSGVARVLAAVRGALPFQRETVSPRRRSGGGSV